MSCHPKLQALRHGDPIRIGKKNFVVWRYAHERGEHRSVTVFVTRGKQTKLFMLVPKDLDEGCVVDVCLVNGMGEVIQGPIVTGVLP